MVVKEPFLCGATLDGMVYAVRSLCDGKAEVLRLGKGELSVLRDAFGPETVLLKSGRALVDTGALELVRTDVRVTLGSGASHSSRGASSVYGSRGRSLGEAVGRFAEAAGFLIED
jgi:hypothetical protein